MIHPLRSVHIPQTPAHITTKASASTTTKTSSTSTPGSTSTTTPSSPSTDGGLSDFKKLFGGQSTNTPAAPTTPTAAAPTAESVFGATPWMTNPTGSSQGQTWGYNPQWFATPETAAKVAQMLGGTVVEQNSMIQYGPMAQAQPNEMVRMPNGVMVNAGLVAGFYTHGYSQQMIDQMIANEVKAPASNT